MFDGPDAAVWMLAGLLVWLASMVGASIVTGMPAAWVGEADTARKNGLTHAGAYGLALTAGVLVVSHWVLDWISHRPDLPLYDDTAKVGLGLWNYVGLSLALEVLLLAGGVWLYLGKTGAVSKVGRYGPVVFALFMLAVQLSSLVGPYRRRRRWSPRAGWRCTCCSRRSLAGWTGGGCPVERERRGHVHRSIAEPRKSVLHGLLDRGRKHEDDADSLEGRPDLALPALIEAEFDDRDVRAEQFVPLVLQEHVAAPEAILKKVTS